MTATLRSTDEEPKKTRKSIQTSMKLVVRSRVARLRMKHADDLQRSALKETRRRRFEELPEEEREAIAEAFARAEADVAEQPGFLDPKGLLSACWELGVGGMTFEERTEVKRICDASGDAVDLHEFALDIVPVARNVLGEILSRELLRQFSFYDTDGSGIISLKHCLNIARAIGLDADMVEQGISAHKCDPVPFDVFQAVACSCREKLQLLLRRYEIEVKNQMNVDEENFQRFRGDIIMLNDLYHEYDLDGNGRLSIDEITFMMRDFGLTSKEPSERQLLAKKLELKDEHGDGEYDFLEFLGLIEEVRQMLQELRKEEREHIFKSFDQDKSESLSIAEISNLLSHLGVAPQNRAEQEELAELILLADDDGSGTMDFEEFQDLCQRIEEKLNRLRFDEEMDLGMCLGFTARQVRDFRYLFDELDSDGSGWLDIPEVHNGLKILGRPVSQQRLQRLFAKINESTDNVAMQGDWVDFGRFLHLMHLLKETSLFSQEALERQEISTPQALDLRTMRRALAGLKMPKKYLATLSRDELVDRICKHLRCRPGKLFQQELGINSTADLYNRFRLPP